MPSNPARTDPVRTDPVRTVIKWNRMRRFGIELEFLESNLDRNILADIVKQALQREHSDHRVEVRGWEHTRNNDKIWVMKTDSTCGYEVCTPPLRGPNELKLFGKIVEALNNDDRSQFNERCGFHIHVDISDFSQPQFYTLLKYWIRIETAVMNSHPGHRRANDSHCISVNKLIHEFQAGQTYTGDQLFRALRTQRAALNVQSYERHKTIEWRMGDMTLDSEDAKNRIRFFVWFVDLTKIMPDPSTLNWYSPKEAMRFLGLLNDTHVVSKEFSPAITSMRNWFLRRLAANMPEQYFERDNETVAEMITELQEQDDFSDIAAP